MLRRKLAPRATTPHAYLHERILEPAGAGVASWRTLRDGTHTLPTGAFVTAHAWLAYGRYLLAAERASRLRECLTGSIPNPRYGLGIWLDPPADNSGIFYASGAGGQALYVMPRHDTVVVHFGGSTSLESCGVRPRAARRGTAAQARMNSQVR